MSARSIALTAALFGAIVPPCCAGAFQLLTAVGLNPASRIATGFELIAALVWPTYLPYGFVLGENGFSRNIIPLLTILTVGNAAIYALLSIIFVWAWTVPTRRILAVIPSGAVIAYWYWVTITFYPR